jgi:MFS family permease
MINSGLKQAAYLSSSRAPLAGADARRAIAAASVGNGLEFYDFVTFAFFAIQIGRAFFPTGSAYLSLMGALATFGAGFITRPIGAWVLGGYADRAGRKPAMLFSMALMGVSIAVLALTPGYARIGIAAPIIAIAARLAQGFALGGEVGSATAYMMEAAAEKRRGYMVSWQGATQQIALSIGALVGLVLALFLSAAQLDSFGWRIALLIGVLIVPFGLMIRRSLPETLHDDRAAADLPPPFRSYGKFAILGFIIIAQGTITTYIFNYMATIGQATLHLSTVISMTAQFGNVFAGFVAVLIGGALSDRHGRRPIMIISQIAFALLIMPCFLWLTESATGTSFLTANIILSFVANFYYGAVYAAITENLPARVRSRVFALVYSVPVAVFGGTTQLVVAWLLRVTGNPMSVGWYVLAIVIVGLGAMLLMPESAPAKREQLAPLDRTLALT